MSEIAKPTRQELLGEDGVTSVLREADDSWRHGSYIYQVFHRKADDTYWAVNYQRSADGEYHGLRDDDYTVDQVWPVTETITKITYVGTQPVADPT